jgi:hypothetical protein
MVEMPVRGEIKALACKEGSSGVFTGSIEGLYQGYRFASTVPEERQFTLDLEHGSIALTVRQEIRCCLEPRPAVHPFENGNDPFADLPIAAAPPEGVPPPVPEGKSPPPGATHPGAPSEAHPERGLVRNRPFFMEVRLRVDPEKSSGIFAGAIGEVEVQTPKYRMPGHLVINTRDGDLRLGFLEGGEKGFLRADLWVDGERSTGIYQGARGSLEFALTPIPPNFGRGPYWGTIWLREKPEIGRSGAPMFCRENAKEAKTRKGTG